MVRVGKSQMGMIGHLFAGIEDSMVIACLQGYMGEAFVFSLDDPKAGLIVSGEYSFFGGDPDSDDAGRLIENLFGFAQCESTVAIFPDGEPGWESRLMSYPQYSPVAVPRFGIVQKDYAFDEDVLQAYIDAFPEGFALVPFNESVYVQAMQHAWSREFCETFESAGDYLKRGFGFAALDGGRLVSGASTMTVYDGGAEVQVATQEGYRRKGLAMPCAASLVRECARRGMRPHWDAANLVSKNMALSLGYEYRGGVVAVREYIYKCNNIYSYCIY